MQKSLWLHNIRSVHNVGSMFRTADAVGIDHIYLSGYTPLPQDRFGRMRSDMAKVAIGAEQKIPWSHLENPESEIADRITAGAHLIGIEQDERSTDIFAYNKTPVSEIIVAMGEETVGMEPWQRDLCHTVLEIPMHGDKESLNVSVACGVALYQIFK